MVLIRFIVLGCLIHNVNLSAEWVATGDNGKADALCALEFDRFRDLRPDMNELPDELPREL